MRDFWKEQKSIFSINIHKCSPLVEGEKLFGRLNSYCAGLGNVPNFRNNSNDVISAASASD